MINLKNVSDEELSKVTQITCPHIPAEKLRQARWSIDHQSNTTRVRALVATIDDQTIIACLFPTRVGPPNENTTYEIGWIAPEDHARALLPS